MPKIKFPAGVFVHVLEKLWMDEDGVKLWIENVWSRRPGGLRKEKSLLVWDMFRAHLTEKSKKLVSSTNTYVTVIPGGLTSLVQPLDHSRIVSVTSGIPGWCLVKNHTPRVVTCVLHHWMFCADLW
ncbi:hypothetical protein Pcinc_010845 [Petrolisthes cinctipes]|uniref:DDE-1 domain-containing protein n=1 Tax=Petrolisthes cinctipes TaxID=88211 RepID=A0AAE1G427_PETCI|nr:hypothetical protein Pcinc_010845 [Petrolisthes cinctipes]